MLTFIATFSSFWEMIEPEWVSPAAIFFQVEEMQAMTL